MKERLIHDEISNLLALYRKKIEDCDKTINSLRIGKRNARTEKNDNYNALVTELKIAQAQRQAYIQAESDIDSLLNY